MPPTGLAAPIMLSEMAMCPAEAGTRNTWIGRFLPLRCLSILAHIRIQQRVSAQSVTQWKRIAESRCRAPDRPGVSQPREVITW